jgi:hypothetical protein
LVPDLSLLKTVAFFASLVPTFTMTSAQDCGVGLNVERWCRERTDARLAEIRSQSGPRNPKPGAAGTFTINPDEDFGASAYHSACEDRAQVEAWKKEWTDHSDGVTAQLEAARSKREELRQLSRALPELNHIEYAQWLSSEKAAVGQRLSYPFLAEYIIECVQEQCVPSVHQRILLDGTAAHHTAPHRTALVKLMHCVIHVDYRTY